MSDACGADTGRRLRPTPRPGARATLRRSASCLLATATLLGAAALAAPATGSAAVAPAATNRVRADTVSVSVANVDPAVPAITATPRPLTITATLVNNGSQTLTGVSLAAERGDPIGSQAVLDDSVSDSSARTGGRTIEATKAPSVTLPPKVPVTATFTTTTSQQNDEHVCLCATASVYPIDLTAQRTVEGSTITIGGTRTYLPTFDQAPTTKVGVTWIWPLIDRPHRTTTGRTFTDDALASSVANGGRLDRALQVVERLSSSQPLTLVVDPELLDELQEMTLGYRVRASNGTLSTGTGQQAASSWLTRLRALLDARPNVLDLQLTPLADPDVTGLTRRNLSWTQNLPEPVSTGVANALGDHQLAHTLAWPPTNAATGATLDSLVAGGAGTVVLDGSRVRPSTRSSIPVSSAALASTGGRVSALLTAPTLQRTSAAMLTRAGSTAAMPQLVSELAVRIAQQPDQAQHAVFAAPRYVDPSPEAAAKLITATSSSLFTRAVSADAAARAGSPGTSSTGTTALRRTVTSSNGLSPAQLDRIAAVRRTEQPVASLIQGSAAGRTVLAALPVTVQLAESAAWSRAGASAGVGGLTGGALRSQALQRQLTRYLHGVRILNRRNSSYTLASSNSKLPITVQNDNALSVQVRVGVNAVGGLPGFADRTSQVVQIGAGSKATVRVDTHIQRTGRIPVSAQLHTPDSGTLGQPVTVFVHSTVLGTIGVVITVVSGVVLALALLVRLTRRMLRLRRKRSGAAPPTPASTPEHEPAS
ncbi:DUF6049 family protein [uncultured Jatrophihabitans sp.]|uniref:DUF6049 family protein n=1 Tax=uncultured Jatrophihabitans sp. TaxID=1610747 RepID=UPI0035CBD398